MSLKEVIETLKAAGVAFFLPHSHRHYSVATAAAMLDCSDDWIKNHKAEFPNMWRMPGGELRVPEGDLADLRRRRELGELRIPARDIDALAERNRLRRAA